MRVLLACHYFAPEVGAPQARLSETARRWAETGHDVQVITGFPNHPDGVIREGYRGRKRTAEKVDGYEVIRTWLYATPNSGFAKKTLGHISWALSSIALGRKLVRRPDVVVVSSPTFFSIFSAWAYAKRYRVPFVLEIRDLWPGIFVELSVLTNRQIIWLLERLELWAYHQADLVVVVTEGFKEDIVSRGIPANKVEVITNGVDLEHFSPGPPDPSVRASLGADAGNALIVYIGAHGISQGLTTLVDAAALLPETTVVAFVGDGSDKPATVDHAVALRASNVRFHDPVPKDDVPDILRSADVLVVLLRDLPLFETFIPSKIFEFLATARPVVGALAGESAEILLAAGGMVVPPGNPTALAEAIDASLRPGVTGSTGATYVSENYDRRVLADRYAALIERCLPTP